MSEDPLNTYPMSGLRMPEGYKPTIGVDTGGKGYRKIDFDDADDLLRRFLPDKFIFAYERLIDKGFGSKNIGSAGGFNEVLTGGGNASKGTIISSESSIRLRRRVDSRLRQMAREIVAYLDGDAKKIEARRCGGKCKRIGDAEWIYCPNCGGPMAQVDYKK